jgi:hypothetical protein
MDKGDKGIKEPRQKKLKSEDEVAKTRPSGFLEHIKCKKGFEI